MSTPNQQHLRDLQQLGWEQVISNMMDRAYLENADLDFDDEELEED